MSSKKKLMVKLLFEDISNKSSTNIEVKINTITIISVGIRRI